MKYITSLLSTTLIAQGARALQPTSILNAKRVLQRSPGWTVNTDFAPARMLMANAFASGEPVVDWLMRNINVPQDDSKDRRQAYDFALSFAVRDGLANGGLVFGKAKDDDANQLECGILFREYDPTIDSSNNIAKDIKSAATILGTYAELKLHGMTRAAPFNGFFSLPTQTFFKRGMHYDTVSKGFHKKYGPTHAHWYISSVGVDPESQGKGYGKLLMKQMGDLADECDMDVYLECAGAFNKGFYEKMGFEEVGVESLEDGTDDATEVVYLMTRPSRNKRQQ